MGDAAADEAVSASRSASGPMAPGGSVPERLESPLRGPAVTETDDGSIAFEVRPASDHRMRVDPILSLVTGVCSQCVHEPGTIAVTLEVSSLSEAINGVQALFQYDAAILSLTSITPGDGVGSPWDGADTIFFEDNGGDVTVALVLNAGQSSADATVASMTFATVVQGTTQVGFRPADPPFLTKLTTASGNQAILPVEIDSTDIIIGQTSKGDLNGDGLRNGADIQGFLDVLLEPGGAPPAQSCAADLNGDGVVDAGSDVLLFVACLLTEACVCP